jgi:hypothetical protein
VGIQPGPLPLDIPGGGQAQLDPGGRQRLQDLIGDGGVQGRRGDPAAGPELSRLMVRAAMVARPGLGALATFQAEAESLLEGPQLELPADVFAPEPSNQP